MNNALDNQLSSDLLFQELFTNKNMSMWDFF